MASKSTGFAASVSSLISLQLVSRLMTFVLNQLVIRMVDPQAYGTVAVQCELFLGTILFISREGARGAFLRFNHSTSSGTKISRSQENFPVRLGLLPLAFGVPLAIVSSLLFVRYAAAEVQQQTNFIPTVIVYAVASLLELLSEPWFNLAMLYDVQVRVRAEMFGVIARTAITFLILLGDSYRQTRQFTLLAFAFGQLGYSISMLFAYLLHYGWRWTTGPSNTGNLGLLRLSLTLTAQSILKHFLTEGDKIILSWLSPLQDQGGYAVAVNYGSLVARIVFQPIEESLRRFFSSLFANAPTSTKETKDERTSMAVFQTGARALTRLLSVQLAFSVMLLVFGTVYLPILLPLLLPPRFMETSAPTILSAWLWYIPVLALNGGLEAFLASTASMKALRNQSIWMIAFSALYISATLAMYRLGGGDESLVYANVVNLTARILYALHYVHQFFPPSVFSWKAALPSRSFLVVVAISHIMLRFLPGAYSVPAADKKALILDSRTVIYATQGATLAIVCLTTWWFTSGRQLLR